MEDLISLALTSYNIELLILIWKQLILAKNDAFRVQIRVSLPQLCDHFHFERTMNFRHFVGRYDQWVFAHAEGDITQKLNKFAALGSIPLVRLCFRELARQHLPATKAALIRDDQLVKLIFETNSFRELSYLAIRGGHLLLLQWLLTNGYPYYPIISREAARYGQTEILKWLHFTFGLDDKICATAAQYGQFTIIKWAYGLGYALSKEVLLHAMKGSYYEVMDWAIENDCPEKESYEKMRAWMKSLQVASVPSN